MGYESIGGGVLNGLLNVYMHVSACKHWVVLYVVRCVNTPYHARIYCFSSNFMQVNHDRLCSTKHAELIFVLEWKPAIIYL